MADLTRGYNVPGVYVRDATGPLVTNAAVPDTVVTLVGPAVGFQAATDVLRLSSTAQSLSYRGVRLATDGSEVFVPIVRKQSGAILVEGTDYVLSQIYDEQGTDPRSAITQIALGALVGDTGKTANGLDSTLPVTVSYAFTSTAYFTPLLFDSFDSIVSTYGQPLRATPSSDPTKGPILSPLALAASFAFRNGATRLICVATDPTTVTDESGGQTTPTFASQLRSAYEKTLGDYRVGVVVPVFADGGTGDLGVFGEYCDDLRNHVESSSGDGYQRIGIIGGQANAHGVQPGSEAPFAEVAEDINSARVLLAYPNRLSYYNPNSARSIDVDGFYLAAALSGVLESNPVNQALTRETVVGFTGLPASVTRLMTKPFKDNLSGRGVCVVEVDRQNRMVVRHGTSTNVTSVVTREISITRARDALFEALQIGLDNSGLIGSPIDFEMTTRIKGAVQGILEGLTQDLTIIAYTDLRVRQQSITTGGDPTVIEVRFAYQPALPLNYIVVTFSLDLTTGTVEIGDATSSLPAAVSSGL